MVKDNQGVSLIEVLISVMIVGVVFLVIMRSFVTSAQLNFKAHMNQQATLAVQEVVEVFKANDDFSGLKDQLSATATVYSEIMWPSEVDLPLVERSKYSEEVFTRYRYKSPSFIASDGTTFDIAVELNPIPYSSLTTTGNEVNNSNTKGIGRIEGIDALNNAVIAEEINTFDLSIIENFKHKIKDAIIASSLNLSKIKKIVEVDIKQTGDRIRVTCSVTYQCIGLVSDTPPDETYVVYSGSFNLEDEETNQWVSGDTIYIMITPFAENDELIITSNYVDPTITGSILRPFGTKPLNIEIVRGINQNNISDPSKCYNLQQILIKEPLVVAPQVFMNRTQNAGVEKSGREVFSDLSVVSNMQGAQGALIDITSTTLEGAIYQDENQELRFMDMTVWVFEEGTLTGDHTSWDMATWEANSIIEIQTTKVVK